MYYSNQGNISDSYIEIAHEHDIPKIWKHSHTSKYKPSNAMRFALKLLASIRIGKIDIILPNNTQIRFQGSEDGPQAVLRIHHDRCVRRFITRGQLGFCEAYLDGDWSSPDIATFFEVILRNYEQMQNELLGKKWVRILSTLMHWLKPNTRKGSRKNIYAHYDIGNDFYKSWLDESMTYSSALFEQGVTDLKTAQNRKYQEIVNRLDLQPHHHVLEIGCGWGGFAEYAAKTIGCKITCLTISQAQYEFAVESIKKAGLDDKVEIRLQDYRDTQGKFDRIASIEMFEAVGESYWPTFFETLKNRLKDDGKSVLQIITIRDQDFPIYRRSADYIQRYIFPGGMLPSMSALSNQIKTSGLRQGDHLSFGKDYARTLKIWNEEFQKAWPHLTDKKLDTRFKRLWEQYLCYCQAGFETERIDVVQLEIHK